MKFKEWLDILERTLYHGTVVDNEPSIRSYGLQGGWHGRLGSFVSKYYDDEDGYGEPTEEDEVVFAADRGSLDKAVNAMVHHISEKLGKEFQDVTDTDIRNHGLLVIIKDGSDVADQYSDRDRRWAYENPPRGAEEGDYFASSLGGDVYLRGSSLIRFLKRNGEWPRHWGAGSSVERERYYRGLLGARAISRGHNKSDVLSKVKNAPLDVIQRQLRAWESLQEGVEQELDPKFKLLFSKRKRNWRKLLEVDPLPRLVRLYELLGTYDRNSGDYWAIVGLRNFIMSVIAGCLVQSLYSGDLGWLFNRYDLLGMVQKIPLVDNLEEALTVARQIYDPNHGIRIGMSSLWTTDLMRSI